MAANGGVNFYLGNERGATGLTPVPPGLRWEQTMLRPVREQVLTPAQQMVANAENLNTIYNTKVAQPVQSVLDQRAQIRAEILKKAGALPG